MLTTILIILTLIVLAVVVSWGGYKITILILRYVFNEMAKGDFLVTFRTDGEIKAIMKGEKCDHYVMAVENYIMDPDDFDIVKGSTKPEDLSEYKKYLINVARRKVQPRLGKLGADAGQNPNPDPSFQDQKLDLVFTDETKQWIDEDRTDFNADFKERLLECNKIPANWFEKKFGIVWVGLPPWNVFRYDFRWMRYAQKKGEQGKPSDEFVMHAREEWVNSLYFRYPNYGIVILDAETGAGSLATKVDASGKKKKGGAEDNQGDSGSGSEKPNNETKPLERIQLKLEIVMETMTVNPQKTLFRTAGLSSAGDWLSALCREVRDLARTWVSEQDYDTFILKKQWARSSLNVIRDLINGEIPDGSPVPESVEKTSDEEDGGRLETKPSVSAIRDYGQRIVKLSLVNVDLKDPQLQNTIDDIFKAEQDIRKATKQARAATIRAEGERATAGASIKGKADGLAEISKIEGGKEMYVAEQIGNIGVYAPGNSNLLLNVPTGTTGRDKPPEKTDDKGKKV